VNQSVNMVIQSNIAVIEIANLPVNALSHEVRLGLQDSVAKAKTDNSVKAIVIVGTGKVFIAGADITEFGKPPQAPILPDLVNEIEASTKPVVAAIHGVALGGGLEVALGAHYRVALSTAQLGFPEVALGLLPGAGGTQRLPRLIPVTDAIQMITKGARVSAKAALESGLIDQLAEGDDIRSAGINFANELIAADAKPRVASQLPCNAADESVFEAARAKVTASARGLIAPQKCIDAVQAAATLPFAEGLALERSLFKELVASDQHKAMRHAFFAERETSKVSGLKGVAAREINEVGIIGGGTMGAGIAVSSLLAGLDVTLVERDIEPAAQAKNTVLKLLNGSVKRGKLSEKRFAQIESEKFRTTTDYQDLASVDLVIEAVFESLEVKEEVFTRLDAICKSGAILASNTSYLNLNDIAAMTQRPDDVIGLHFFSPAHVMKLLEVVVGEKTADTVVASSFALAKKLGKVAVRSGVCEGFIGNRILTHYRKAIDGAVLAGASPFAIDKALVKFGLAMGPFSVSDLAGLDIGWSTRKRLASTRNPREQYAEFADRICEQGNFGRKTGKGFYTYADGQSTPNPEVETYIENERTAKGIVAREIDNAEIVDRYMAAMVNEAARVVGEGIAQRPLDVDVTLMNGYGFPRWRGGPMQYADTVGLEKILADIQRFALEDDWLWQPALLLEQLVAEGKTFASLNTLFANHIEEQI